jgi:hypothetical protein
MLNALFHRTLNQRLAATAKVNYAETTTADFSHRLSHRDRRAIERNGKTERTKFRAKFAR